MTRPSAATRAITIRPAYADDDAALARLASLDSAERVPERPLLLAEVDGQLRAALPLRGGAAIADPFFPTAELIELLRFRAAAAGGDRPRLGVRPLRRPRSSGFRPTRHPVA